MRVGLFSVGSLLLVPTGLLAQSAVVPKTNPMKVYAHMMPWFQTPETLGANNWGYHWKFNTRNPNIIDANGQREIASNYYPLTGPYDSTDPNIIEYQMLLMKLSGIDGVIVDWYGQQGSNGDIGTLLTASNDIVNSTGTYGLQFAAMLEDRFATSTSEVSTNITYLRQNYFNKSNYIRTGSSNSPLMPIFGPITYTQPTQWNTIMAGSPGETIDALPLWYQSQQLGSNAGGEFSWIYEDPGTNDHLTQQQNFLTIQSPSLKKANSAATVMGVAYPGFNDYYSQGGTGTVIPFNPIPSNNGQTLASVLAVDSTYSSDMNMLQLATWNDYGEGTMLEPTVQTGFTYLMQLQKFTGVAYGLPQLEMVYQLYEQRTAYTGNSTVQAVLNQASADINQLDFTDAATTLNQYQTVTWTGNGSSNHWSSTNWSASTVVSTNSLVFSGTKNLTTLNDLPYQTQFDGFTFAAGAGAFVLSGNPVNLYGDIVNNSSNLESISLSMSLQENAGINASSGDIAISGDLSDGLYGPTAITKLGTHVLTLSGTNSYTGATTISAGVLAVGAAGSLASNSITVASGATFIVDGALSSAAAVSVSGNVLFGANTGGGILNRTLAAINLSSGATVAMATPTSSANRTVLVVGALSFAGTTNAWQGLFDLSGNDLILHGGNAGIVANQIEQAYNGGTWTGSGGITSSIAGTGHLMALGFGVGGALFDGVTTTGADVLVKYTYYGDANLDGKVDGSDYSLIDSAYLTDQAHPGSSTGWSNGDFNYDGVIDGSDYALIDNLFNTQGASLSAAALIPIAMSNAEIGQSSGLVPEPATSGSLGVAGAGFLVRRRRKLSHSMLRR